MKKTLPLFVLLLALGNISLNAQFEIKGLIGTNFSSLTKPPEGFAYAAKAGYQFGVGVLIGDKFYVEPGVQFVRNSKAITVDTEEFRFSQIPVKSPVYAGYHLLGHESGPVALRLFAGPAVSIPGKITKGEEQISKDDIRNSVWLVDAGVGVDIFFLFVELNYEHSFTEFFDSDAVDSGQNGFLINAGIHIDF